MMSWISKDAFADELLIGLGFCIQTQIAVNRRLLSSSNPCCMSIWPKAIKTRRIVEPRW